MQKFSFFLGIDISKEWFDVALITATGSTQAIAQARFENTETGFQDLFKWLKTHTDGTLTHLFICMEHTGVYTVPLCCFLEEQAVTYTLVPGLAIRKSLGITRGKTDKIDALRIARYIRKNHAEISLHTLPTVALRKLKRLIMCLKQLKKHKNAYQVTLKVFKEFDRNETFDATEQIYQDLLKGLKAQIKEIEQQMLSVIKEHPALKRNYDLCISVKGIGPLIATHLIVYTQNFVTFTNARKFACYAGIAPFPYGSGKIVKKDKVSHLANKIIKTLLTNGARSAILYCPEIRAYYDKQIGKGKNEFSVVNVVRNKLVSRVFAVVKRGTPYVPLSNHYTLTKK